MDRSVSHFEESIVQWMDQCRLLTARRRLLLAVSGGMDSMAMLEVFFRLKNAGAIDVELAVGHVNHQLRGSDSDADCRFVQEQAARRGMDFLSGTVDAAGYARQNRVSIETAARLLRLQQLAQMACTWKADAVATAHHQDDQLETLVFRLLRGTGFYGLCGIKPATVLEKVLWIRPMLAVNRHQILEYCKSRQLSWREDITNADCHFSRNRIRHYLLPFLRQSNGPSVDAALLQLARNCQSLFEKIDGQVRTRLAGAVQSETAERMELNRACLADACPLVLAELFRQCLLRLNAPLRDYTQRHYHRLMEAIYRPKRTRSILPDGLECRTDEKTLTLQWGKKSAQNTVWQTRMLEIGRPCRFGPWRISAVLTDQRQPPSSTSGMWTEYLDADRICGPLRIRLRKPGDRFVPLGMRSSKKVGKFLTATHVDPKLKEQSFIIEDSQKILWVAPLRISEQAKMDAQTVRILQLSIYQ